MLRCKQQKSCENWVLFLNHVLLFSPSCCLLFVFLQQDRKVHRPACTPEPLHLINWAAGANLIINHTSMISLHSLNRSPTSSKCFNTLACIRSSCFPGFTVLLVCLVCHVLVLQQALSPPSPFKINSVELLFESAFESCNKSGGLSGARASTVQG